MASNIVAPLAAFCERDGPLEIVDILQHEPSSRRLSELGFCTGKRVTVVKAGNPAILELNGARFGLGDELQNLIFARPLAR